MRVRFSNGIITAEADTHGAELVSVAVGGRERLWQNQSGEWSGHAPVLFPVCGKCSVLLNGREYEVGRHGFARNSEFTLVEERKNAVSFQLRSSAETKLRYPFDFIFRVRYLLIGARLKIVYEIENPSAGVLYFSCGAHESFALERPVGEHELLFSRKENFSSLLHDENGCLNGEAVSFGEGTRLALDEDFLSEGRTIIFKGLRSRRVVLCERGGNAVAKIKFSGFPNLLLWRAGQAPFLCIEPWHNLPDDGKSVAFPNREGVIALHAHQKKKFTREIEYLY